MAGQISIRLSDKIISDLNRIARKRKSPRADIIRACLIAGLEQVTKPKEESLSDVVRSARNEILKSIEELARELKSEPKTVTGEPIQKMVLSRLSQNQNEKHKINPFRSNVQKRLKSKTLKSRSRHGTRKIKRMAFIPNRIPPWICI